MVGPRRLRILHFAEDGDSSGFFPQLARFHNRSRFKMMFGTLRTITPELHRFMEMQSVEVLSLDAKSRVSYPRALLHMTVALRRLGVDVLHTHLFEPSVVGLVAGVLARVPTRVMTRHYSDYHTRIAKTWHV